MNVKKIQFCLFALLIGCAFLLQNCQKDEIDLKDDTSEANLKKGSMKFEILDLAFENALLANGINVVDHHVFKKDVNKRTELDISGEKDNKGGIVDLSGIEHFRQLRILNCSFNQLTSLDVSKNTFLKGLFCQDNALTSLDVSKNKALTGLFCSTNQLSSLDLCKNTDLDSLHCARNLFTSLDVSRNTALTDFNCQYNALTSLDVTKNTALTSLKCQQNELASLDVSMNTALGTFQCSNNLLTSLDISMIIDLITFHCKSNLLDCIQVSQTQFDNIPPEPYWKKDGGVEYSLDCN